jgi:hypothetical protein
LYFGEFGNNTPAVPVNYALLPRGDADVPLFVSVLPMPFSTTAQRSALRSELLWAYNSAWQAKEVRAAGSGVTNQLGIMDTKPYPEHAAQIPLHLTGVNKILDPQPEREPRRRIGFVP